MATCNVTLPTATLETSSLDVIDKYKLLTAASLDTDSVYMRAKDTFKELLDSAQMDGVEYAQYASQFISQLATATTQSAMNIALQWSQAEKESAYTLAQTKANIELAQANRELIKMNICATEKEIDSKCAQITATLAQSIRENGTVATYAADGCTPLTLNNNGVKYAQTKAQEANMYATLSDSFRKSGVVTIGTDADGVWKGTAGSTTYKGYTDAQEKFARRQIVSFEDSKRNHALNALSSLIGGIMAHDLDPLPEHGTQWNTAMNYLNRNSLDVDGDGFPDPVV